MIIQLLVSLDLICVVIIQSQTQLPFSWSSLISYIEIRNNTLRKHKSSSKIGTLMEEYWDSRNGWMDCKNVGIGRNSKTDLFGQGENKPFKKNRKLLWIFLLKEEKSENIQSI